MMKKKYTDINVYINGKKQSFMLYKPTLNELVKELPYNPRNIAIELNEVVIPKSQYDVTEINENDKIEIVEFVGGG